MGTFDKNFKYSINLQISYMKILFQTFDVNLRIPPDLALPNLVECQLLESIYRVEVTGITSGFNRDLNFVIAEIKIGHVDGPDWAGPSSSTLPVQSAYPSMPQVSGYPYPPEGKSKPPLGFEGTHPSAPPSYQEINGAL